MHGDDIVPTLRGKEAEPPFVTHTLRGDGCDASEDGTGRGSPLVAGTVRSKWSKGTGGPAGDECQNIIAEPVAYNVTFCDANGRRADRPNGGLYVSEADTTKTITHGGELSTYITIPLQEIGKRTGTSTDDASIGMGIGNDGDAMYTLQSSAQHGVASFKPGNSAKARGIGYEEEVAPTLKAGGGGNSQSAVLQHMAVRRLTPRECERLQGFPVDYTLVPYRGKPAADGNRYKALGNSMAVPLMLWLGERIAVIEVMLSVNQYVKWPYTAIHNHYFP
jgi:DNA (cytosine-5)-methyltransferase 1